ncbi:hypothetical protein [Cohnella herbarum]|uniref:Uncharacterized protein n=1 Tax=Cohnella herbarum TaxID=2728023 RepID=A0A7Z2ZJP0_9BACL|nr:hypothetical protein [Cohnella herbarum]QJD82416.1 hypothetical protein HH215_03930 [Cohnella herbarum]
MPVFGFKQYGVMLLIGIVAVFMLSRLPFFEESVRQRKNAVVVFQPKQTNMLTDDTLVDRVSKLQLSNQILKVGWDHSILTIDLLGYDPEKVWVDMGQLIIFSYEKVHNVKQVLIRAFADKGDQRILLLAAETRRSDWSDKELTEISHNEFRLHSNLESNLRLSITPSGKRWIANFANS